MQNQLLEKKHDKIGTILQLSKYGNIELSYRNKEAEEAILNPIEVLFYDVNDAQTNINIDTNALVYSDNCYALYNLIKNNIKVDLIYIDPPYCTGEKFISRNLEQAYNDDLSLEEYIDFMRKRLILLKEVLSDNGSIYVHIGHQMVAYIKILMDEIFGINNFKNIITRKKCSSKNYTKNQYANLNDFVLFYTKTKKYTWNKPGIIPNDEWIQKEYPKVDKNGRYKLVPIHAPGIRNGETGKKWRNMLPPPGKHWQYTPEKLEEMDKKGEIHWSCNGNPRRKVYFDNNKLLSITDYWDNYRDAYHQSIKITGYPTEKNLDMLKMIIAASSNPGDTVLDAFCGSGTTLQAADELDRKWIGIDQSPIALKTCLKRLNYGLSAMGDYVKPTKCFPKSGKCKHKYNIYIEESKCINYKKIIDSVESN